MGGGCVGEVEVVVVVLGLDLVRRLERVEEGSIGGFGIRKRGKRGIVGGMGLWFLGMQRGGGGEDDGVGACSIVGGDVGRCCYYCRVLNC